MNSLTQTAQDVTVGKIPFTFGKQDAKDKATCCPEMYFVRHADQVEYCWGYATVGGHNDTTRYFIGESAIKAMEPTIEQTIEQEYEAIKRYCSKKLSYSQDAHDIAHQAIVKALSFVRRHPDFKADRWAGWLWTVVYNTIRDKIRYDDARLGKYLGIDECIAPQSGSCNNLVIDSKAHGTDDDDQEIGYHTDFAADMQDRMVAKMLRDLIAKNKKLTPIERNSIILHYYYGYTRAEIGRILFPDEDSKTSLNRCVAAIYRARLKLKKLLGTKKRAAQLAGWPGN